MSWTHLSDERPKARKAHVCYLCGRPIAVGEQHIRRVGVNEDGLFASRMHITCEALTAGWDEDSWEYHDSAEFRECYLAEARS